MYHIGDRVIYGIHGVCCVVDLEDRIVDRKHMEYLVLEPVGQDGSRYMVPTHNEVAMKKIRPMLTVLDFENMFNSQKLLANEWIQDENLRKQTYRELISSGDRVALMKMLNTLYRHKQSQAAAGKKVHQCDENFLRDTEKLLSSEISLVMHMDIDEARQYLQERLKSE